MLTLTCKATGKPEQSYRPAYSRVTLTFDLLTSGSVHADLPCAVCTKFGVDSSNRIPFRARTQTHEITDATGVTKHRTARTAHTARTDTPHRVMERGAR